MLMLRAGQIICKDRFSEKDRYKGVQVPMECGAFYKTFFTAQKLAERSPVNICVFRFDILAGND